MPPRAVVESNVETSRSVEDARESLLDAISGVGGRGRVASDLQKKVIDDCVRVLEEDGGLQNPTEAESLEGRWQLVYTTRPGTASPIQRSFVGVDAFTVFQEIVLRNTDDPRVTNTVNFGKKIGELRVEAVASIATGVRINFRFDRAAFHFQFLPFKVPYPVPFKLLDDEAKGWLDTVYLSPEGNLRISKGNKGTTFVLQRNPGPRQKLLLAVKSKRDVEQAIEELKPLNPNIAPAKSEALSGKWRLVWTSQARNANPLQKLSAGFASNWQIIDGDTGTLENLVTAVFGFVKLRANADTETTSPVRTNVFIRKAAVEVGPVKIPLNLNGRGFVEQLYLDDKLRISRGSKGSTFIHVRDD
ncbi:fibrillin family protein [Klebsormidium nitens]|uniref:Fibrillin family protein n=1 Tax=Klebsormidium nitens TaxID=105231 RepID=A0A1Y1IM24_KLENI|nr:fibrillin family protein [Klebsormidium nitens]|eukprot:GAQ90499.1 fibrillin family protein [Klebsormidium nitens]